MVLRSERSLKSKMLSLARTSKYVNDTSVLSIEKSEEDRSDKVLAKLDSYCSDELIFMISNRIVVSKIQIFRHLFRSVLCNIYISSVVS